MDRDNPSQISPRILSRDEHSISRKQISPNALKVMYRLNGGGYGAYLVGGGIRDILLGEQPKDFDIATDATPEQVKSLFRNSRIIGRRFRIVHVTFGREIIEVTTFRGNHENVSKGKNNNVSKQAESGMLLRDNVYGSIEEDAIRRDFTINALYYSADGFTLHDYTNGLKDIDSRNIRIIGDAETRYREDPVRMLRAARFAAKLSFDIEPATAEPIEQLAPLLRDIPSARLFDEVLKLFMSGYAVAVYDSLMKYHLFGELFPETQYFLEKNNDPIDHQLIRQALVNTDLRLQAGKTVTPAFIFAALLWPVARAHAERLEAEGVPAAPALHEAAHIATMEQLKRTSIPKRFSIPMREIWDLQIRLTKRQGKRAHSLSGHPRFRAAYDFLLLREQAGEQLNGLGAWWTQFQIDNPIEPQQRQYNDEQGNKDHNGRPPRRRRGMRRNGNNNHSQNNS
ncbi:Poly(A) polymerase I [Sinobacterium norvegicum]|uniref:Poly(A) polymerase I n=1 Tax=Sinobacterium norvegicum TaxID=1641715 RepID=A0ABM9AGA9_9GAMM|nr:polynucleotide adenylyltransferase PcnB [Sinobacterium norvegicum]CAH0992250.1 Poly(A) polymerase I [Sinobacterium norvegicum]